MNYTVLHTGNLLVSTTGAICQQQHWSMKHILGWLMITHIEWESRAHFYGIAARIMRRVLVDNARRYRALKRGGGQSDESFDEARFVPEERVQEVIDVDDALTQLCRIHERWCRVVECKYFGGLKEDEIAKILGVSVRTVERDWAKARTWLYNHMYPAVAA